MTFLTLFVVAILSGVLTIIAPCILSLLPIMLGSSLGGGSRWRPLVVVLGMIVSFAAFGFVFALSTTFLGLSRETIRNLATIFIFVFGLALLFPLAYARFEAWISGLIARVKMLGGPAAPSVPRPRQGLWGAFTLGASMGVAWIPCAGPVLGIILTIATVEKNVIGGTILFLAYALGAGVPMLVIGYSGNWIVRRVRWLASKAERIRQVAGALLVIMALAVFFGIDKKVQVATFRYFANTSQIEEMILENTVQKDTMQDMKKNMVNPADFLPVFTRPATK